MIKKIFAFFLVSFCCVSVAQADCVQTTSQLVDDGSVLLVSNTRIGGESFTSNSGKIESITYRLVNATVDNIDTVCTTSLYNTSGDYPTSTVLAAVGMTIPYIDGATAQNFTYNFGYNVTTGTKYALAVRCAAGTVVLKKSTTESFASGTLFYSGNSGSSYTTLTGDAYFSLVEGGIPCVAPILATSTPAFVWFTTNYLFAFAVIVGCFLALAFFRLLRDLTLTIWQWYNKL